MRTLTYEAYFEFLEILRKKALIRLWFNATKDTPPDADFNQVKEDIITQWARQEELDVHLLCEYIMKKFEFVSAVHMQNPDNGRGIVVYADWP